VRRIGVDGMLEQLRASGFLRRDPRPDPRVVVELFTNQLARMQCAECGATQMRLAPWDSGEDPWNDARVCEVCRQPIPRERLDLFPEVTRCAQCMHLPEGSGEEYCRVCGGLMTLKQTRGGGITRYRMVCSECGR
jgi:hypothetical protein